MPRRAKAAQHGLGVARRLTRRVDFERLLQSGTRRSRAGCTVYLARREDGPPRLGILVSRRHSTRATERNALKRCVREAFRLQQLTLGPVDLLVRPPYGSAAGPALQARLREIFAGLQP